MSLHPRPLPPGYSDVKMYINHQVLPPSLDSRVFDPPPESIGSTFPSVISELFPISRRVSPEDPCSGISKRKLQQYFMNLKHVTWTYFGPDDSFSVSIQTRNVGPKGNIFLSGFDEVRKSFKQARLCTVE
jgi:hypothetical protein